MVKQCLLLCDSTDCLPWMAFLLMDNLRTSNIYCITRFCFQNVCLVRLQVYGSERNNWLYNAAQVRLCSQASLWYFQLLNAWFCYHHWIFGFYLCLIYTQWNNLCCKQLGILCMNFSTYFHRCRLFEECFRRVWVMEVGCRQLLHLQPLCRIVQSCWTSQ